MATDRERKPSAREEREKQEQRRQDRALEQGLEDTFPASDPVAITQPPHSKEDKREAARRR
jgi:hypothetical protein